MYQLKEFHRSTFTMKCKQKNAQSYNTSRIETKANKAASEMYSLGVSVYAMCNTKSLFQVSCLHKKN